MIKMICPSCGMTLAVSDEYEGMEGRCRKCGGKVVAPLLACVPPEFCDEDPPTPPAQFIPDAPITQLEVLPPSRTFEEEEARLRRIPRMPNGVYCRACGATIHSSAKACPVCGTHQEAAPSPRTVRVKVESVETVTFAVVTLIFLLLLFPVGFILNLVGLVTGPKRGCFLAMLLAVSIPGLLIFLFWLLASSLVL